MSNFKIQMTRVVRNNEKNRLNLLFVIILIMVFSSGQNFSAKGRQQKNQSLIILNGNLLVEYG